YTREELLEGFPPPPRHKPDPSAPRPKFNGHAPHGLERFHEPLKAPPTITVSPSRWGRRWPMRGAANRLPLRCGTAGAPGPTSGRQVGARRSGKPSTAPALLAARYTPWQSSTGIFVIHGTTRRMVPRSTSTRRKIHRTRQIQQTATIQIRWILILFG